MHGTPSQGTPARTLVRFLIRHRFAEVETSSPIVETLLRSALAERTCRVGPKGQPQFRTEPYYQAPEQGGFWIPTGLVAAAQRHLELAGYQVEVENQTQLPACLMPDRAFLEQLKPQRQELLRDLGQASCLLIEYGPYELEQLLVDVIALHAQALVLVLAQTRASLDQLSRFLQRQFPREVAHQEEWQRAARCRILVGTVERLGCFCEDDCPLLLVPHARDFQTPAFLTELQPHRWTKLLGFLPAGTHLSRQEDRCLRRIYGPKVSTNPASVSDCEVKVQVSWCLGPPSTVPRTADALERKRTAYWHHAERNALIARLAQACAAADLDALTNLGLFLEREPNYWMPKLQGQPVRVLVENPEHGRALRECLPDWELLDSLAAAEARFPVPRQLPRLMILTQQAARVLKTPVIGVLIRATGTEWKLPWPGCPGWGDRAGQELLLLDLADDFDEEAAQATVARARGYLEQDWLTWPLPSKLRSLLLPELKMPGSQRQRRSRQRSRE